MALLATDFSNAGYGGGGTLLPDVPTVVTLGSTGGDDTRLLQGALDHVAELPIQANGYRGALQLAKGKILVAGQLLLKTGVVLRGSGNRETTIVATGNGRRSLLPLSQKTATLILLICNGNNARKLPSFVKEG